LFVLPSLFGEGLPMVVLEAMAAGVPVIATRVEGVPEAIEDGVSGRIARPNDAVDLARCLRSVMSGECDWSALRQCALFRHREEFSDRRMAARLAAVYQQVLGPKPARQLER
jgi:glycosyltransferase involved in cell wall biosynthesis